MGDSGPLHLRRTTNVVLDALVQAVERAAAGRPLSLELLDSVVAGLKTQSSFESFYQRAFDELREIVEAERSDRRRANAFGRLMVEPLREAFDQGRLDRALTPALFSFLHMVLGDEAEAMAARCAAIVDERRAERGGAFVWADFYGDAEARRLQWGALVQVARSFKRFELRKDWFVKLMQYRPTAVSLASNAFVPLDSDGPGEAVVFGDAEFVVLFRALFRPLVEIAPLEEPQFVRAFGAGVEDLVGPFLDQVEAVARTLG